MTNGMVAVMTTDFQELELVHRGKVRDMYRIPGYGGMLLMVATDRISAYDVVMNEPILGKGKILTQLSLFWLDLLADMDNHLLSANVDKYPEICLKYSEQLRDRSMLVRKANPLPIECIVRGYISGSFWGKYCKSPVQEDAHGKFRMVLGHRLPSGMQESEEFPEAIFTPSTKAEIGKHDENISFEEMVVLLEDWLKVNEVNTKYFSNAKQLAGAIERFVLRIYGRATRHALAKGIIIADTKFELAIDDNGNLMLIDEVLTPDSSRFWPLDQYRPGKGQPSYDKQFLRDYLQSLVDFEKWDKTPPAPDLPDEIIEKTRQRYEEALERITAQ
ncbi:MAG: phosphoribosylaminoimidazolesuccinocarboxamide synthase [Parcubacteria group bacterium]